MAPLSPTRSAVVGSWVVAGLATVLVVSAPIATSQSFLFDLTVYHEATWRLLGGGDLYEYGNARDAPFTYPPFAVLVLGVFALPGIPVGGVLIVVASVAAAVVLAWILTDYLAGTPELGRLASRPVLLPLSVVLVVIAQPVRSAIEFGQIGLLLAAVVVLDARPATARWLPQGVLTGLVGAVKLTPLVFGVHYLARRQHRAVLAVAAAFLAATAVGTALLYEPSVRYWTEAIFDVGRVGDPARKISQSATSVLSRAGVPHDTMRVIWPVIALGVAGWAYYVVRHRLDEGRWLHAVVVVGCAGVLISPVSWPHHQVWAVLGIPLLAAHPARWARALAVVAAALFLIDHVVLAEAVDRLVGHLSGVPAAVLVEGRVIVMVAMIVAFSSRPAAPRRSTESAPLGDPPTQIHGGSQQPL